MHNLSHEPHEVYSSPLIGLADLALLILQNPWYLEWVS